MPAVAKFLTLVEVARQLYPHDRGHSAYNRIYQMIRYHRNRCPVKFSYLRSKHNGRNVMVVAEQDVPALKQWLEEKV